MPEATQRFDLVVSGASFAGLALAEALSQALGDSFRIAIVDRAARNPGERPDARAFALSAASVHLLDVLGIWRAVRAEAQPVSDIDITDSSLDAGIRPVVLTYDNHIDSKGGHALSKEPATFIVPAIVLERALLAAAAANACITIIAPAELTGIAATDAGISVMLKDAAPIAASLLVGAEGRRSATREAAGIDIIGWSYDQTAIVTTVQHAKPHEARAVQHFLPGGPFALLPLTGGHRSCITWSENSAEARRILALDDAGFLAEVEQRVGGRLGSVELVGPRQSWPLETHLAKSYVAPRIAIIGDAAHGVHPIAGQGLNLGFRDVAALTEVLAESRRLGLDLGDWDTLKRYERWRRFDSAVSTATFDALNRLFSNDSALLRATRDFGLGIVDRTPILKKLFVTEASGTLGSDVPRLLKGEAV